MPHTTPDNVSALTGLTFTTSSNPTTAQVTTIITWSDRQVDSESLTNTSILDLERLSTLLAGHLVTISHTLNFEVENMKIDTRRQSSMYLKQYNTQITSKKDALFIVTND